MFLHFELIKLGLVLLVVSSLVSCKGRDPLLQKSYEHYIGYLDPETTISSKGFEVCGQGKISATHHGAEGLGYKPNKWGFKKRIENKYDKKNYTDSGYVFFRFIVNCNGLSGRFEIIQTNLEMEEVTLNPEMVEQLYELTKDGENWNAPKNNISEPINYYTYVFYKIQNGEITEILP